MALNYLRESQERYRAAKSGERMPTSQTRTAADRARQILSSVSPGPSFSPSESELVARQREREESEKGLGGI